MNTPELPEKLQPLHRQLFTSMLVALILLSATAAFLHHAVNRQANDAAHETDLQKKSQLLSTAITLPFVSRNLSELQTILKGFGETDGRLLAATVIDTGGNVIADWKKPSAPITPAASAFHTKVSYHNETIGNLGTRWLNAQPESVSDTTASLSTLVSIGILTLMALYAVYFIQRFTLKPWKKILSQTEAALSGKEQAITQQELNSIEYGKLSRALLKLGCGFRYNRDVQHQLEKAQQNSQELKARFDLILNSAGSGIYLLDKVGKIIFVNTAATEILGWDNEECTGRCLHELIQNRASANPEDKKTTALCSEYFFNNGLTEKQEFHQTVTDSKKHEVADEIFWNKAGQPIAVKYVSTPILENGELTGVVIIFEEINHRLEAEQQLKDGEALQQSILESSLAAIVTIDEEGKIFEFNKNAENMFGYKKDDILSKEMAELIIPLQYRDAHRQGMKTYLQTGGHAILRRRIEATALKASGEEFPIELVISPIKLQNKLLFTSFINDITEKNRAKTAIENARIAAENANKAKSQFLAAMSHEIRTPLNAIIGVNELMQTTELDLEQQEYVKIAHQAGISLQEVINNILDYSKVEAGKMEFHLQKTDILAVVDSVLSIMEHKATEKKLDLFATVDYPIPEKTLIDPARLRQILLNLVSNAIKFTSKGSVEIRVGMKNDPLGGDSLQFSVTDTGIGVSEDAKQLIFEEFTQADLSTTRKYGGTGLGLAIASRLVSLFGGEIGAESVEGRGSTFWFTVIPATKELTSPLVFENLNCYVFNSVQKSTYALYKNLNALSANVKFISETSEITDNAELSVVLIDERQLAFLSDDEIKKLYALNRRNVVKVLITTLRHGYHENKALGYFDTHLIRPLQIKQLTAFLYSCIESYNLGEKFSPPNAKKGRVSEDMGDAHHILLVEDSINNQRVIKAMLEKTNYEVDIANNGHEALEKTKVIAYDMILMDISMPIMGGMETTEYLRKNEGPNQKTPIIALTASAYDDKKDDCLQIGMNGFLAKPLNMASLQKEIARLLKNKPEKLLPTETTVSVPVPPLTDNDRIIDYNVLEQLKADTSEHLLPELLGIFLTQSEIRVNKIEQAIQEKDFPVFASEIHALKSESATYGAVKLGELAAEINLLCHRDEKGAAFKAAKPLREYWLSAFTELKQYHTALSKP